MSTDKRNVPVKVGSKTYNLRFNYDALTTIEDTLGKPFLDVFLSLTKLSFTSVKVVFWAGLRKNHPEVALEDVGAILDECEELPQMIKALTASLQNFFNKKTDAPEEKKTSKKGSMVTTAE